MADRHQKHRILVVSDYRSVVSSRPEAEIFIRLARLGHTVQVITYPDADYYIKRFREAGIKVHTSHPLKKWSRSFMRLLRHYVKSERTDIVHVFNSKALTNAVWALRGLPVKLIAYRGYAGQTHWYDPTMYTKYFHPRVNYIWCVSHEIEHILARNMPWGRHKLKTIPKGHDPAWYQGIQPAEREALGLKDTDVVVSFVANLRPFKGLNDLLRATQLLPPDLPFHFLFIGKGYDAPEVQAEMSQSPYRKQFHVLGYREDASSLVAASDCLILTSTHGEGLSKSVVEAMSLGIAPIVTDIPANEGVVIDGDSGWVIPPTNPRAIASALTEMAADKNERLRRGERARLRMQTHFHIDQTVIAFEKWYEEMTRHRP